LKVYQSVLYNIIAEVLFDKNNNLFTKKLYRYYAI